MKNPAAKTITYSYDANSNRSLMIDPDGGRFTYAYDNRSALKTLKNPQDDLTTFSYDAAGQRTLKKLANGTRASHTYDAAGNLDKLFNFKSDNSVISSFDYSNNAVNNRTSVVESSGDRVTWSYDNSSQLLTEHRSGANAYSQTYTYDAAGNRLTNKVDSVISTYIYDESNQLIVCETSGGSNTFTFDNNGNQRTEQSPGGAVTTNTWDYENRLTNMEQPGVDNLTFVYDPDGLRVSKKQSANETKFVWDDQAYLLETDGSDATTAAFTNEPSIYGSLISQRKSSNTNIFHFDGLGSTHSVTASDESITDTFIFDAWGNEVARSGSTDIDFQYVGSQGYYHDVESDLFYIRARHLNPDLARWLSEDPLGTIVGLNLFMYVQNNPIEFIDPNGLVLMAPAPKPKCKKGKDTIYENKKGCKDICEKAAVKYKGLSGSVFCECKINCAGVVKCTKCACVFDVDIKKPKLKLDFTQCPNLAKCACDHETSHLNEVVCDKSKTGIERAPFKPGITERQSECPKRKKDLTCIIKAARKDTSKTCLETAASWADMIADYLKDCPK